MNTMRSEEKQVKVAGRVVGFTYKTLGGFWRGWSNVGIGYGPFATETEAQKWVETTNTRNTR